METGRGGDFEKRTNTEGSEVFETAEWLGEARQHGERWSQTDD